MSRRTILVGASIAGHAALFTGVLVLGAWDLEPVEHTSRARVSLAVMTPPAPQGGAISLPKQDLPRKPPREVVKGPRQPRPRSEPEIRTAPVEDGTGDGQGQGQGQGPAGGDGPEVTDPCAGGSCGAPPAPPPLPEIPRPKEPEIHSVAPQILKGLRVSGETAIHPPRDVFEQMHRSGDRRTSAAILLCLAADGSVSSVTLKRSTRYAGYDEAILGAARRWRYRPYTVNGRPAPACGMVTFLYEITR